MEKFMNSIYGDFQNADKDGNVRLNTQGTLDDLKRLGIKLKPGLEIIISDGELRAEGVTLFSKSENLWVAKVDWSKI